MHPEETIEYFPGLKTPRRPALGVQVSNNKAHNPPLSRREGASTLLDIGVNLPNLAAPFPEQPFCQLPDKALCQIAAEPVENIAIQRTSQKHPHRFWRIGPRFVDQQKPPG